MTRLRNLKGTGIQNWSPDPDVDRYGGIFVMQLKVAGGKQVKTGKKQGKTGKETGKAPALHLFGPFVYLETDGDYIKCYDSDDERISGVSK